MRQLRIAVFSYGLPVPGERRGGIERVAHEVADGLARRGHPVIVWTHDPAPPEAAYEVRPLPWKRFVGSWVGRRVTMGYLGNLLALCPKYGDAELLIAHGDSLLLPCLGKPVIRVMHGSALGEAWSASSPGRGLLQLGVYVQELVTAASQTGCVAVSRNAARYNPFLRRIIPNGVNTDMFYADPASKTPHPSVLFVGRLEGRKRGMLLLRRFAEDIRPEHPAATLVIVGSRGPSAPGVEYHTGITDADLAALYRSAWVYASPSTYEGFGLPYLEAMASGTPVVATPNPGSRELLDDGQFGVLARDDEFGAAIASLLADRARRDVMAERGRQRAHAFSLKTTLDAYETLALELCGYQ